MRFDSLPPTMRYTKTRSDIMLSQHPSDTGYAKDIWVIVWFSGGRWEVADGDDPEGFFAFGPDRKTAIENFEELYEQRFDQKVNAIPVK